jgi:hypothetical protein
MKSKKLTSRSYDLLSQQRTRLPDSFLLGQLCMDSYPDLRVMPISCVVLDHGRLRNAVQRDQMT